MQGETRQGLPGTLLAYWPARRGAMRRTGTLRSDVERILGLCPDIDGFYGASSMERLPTEQAITATTSTFVNLRRS